MSNPVIKSVVEMVNEQPNVDRTEAFEGLWGIFGDLRTKVDQQFELQRDASTDDLKSYTSLPGQDANGSLNAFSGPEMDWLVHSWIGNPKFSFVNMHLTCWLPATTRVPHLAFALATLPDIFFYMDYVPRVDLMADTETLDKYYEPANPRGVELRGNPNMRYFYSRSLYVRQSLSDTALCYTCDYSPENLALVSEVAHEMMDRWLGWLQAGDPTPEDQVEALAERDLYIRRTIAERDPANVLGEKMFGVDLTNRLVRGLWGGDRILPRPHVK